MSRSPHSERDVSAHIYVCSRAEAQSAQTPLSFPHSAGLSAGPCSWWQLGKHRLMN